MPSLYTYSQLLAIPSLPTYCKINLSYQLNRPAHTSEHTVHQASDSKLVYYLQIRPVTLQIHIRMWSALNTRVAPHCDWFPKLNFNSQLTSVQHIRTKLHKLKWKTGRRLDWKWNSFWYTHFYFQTQSFDIPRDCNCSQIMLKLKDDVKVRLVFQLPCRLTSNVLIPNKSSTTLHHFHVLLKSFNFKNLRLIMIDKLSKMLSYEDWQNFWIMSQLKCEH